MVARSWLAHLLEAGGEPADLVVRDARHRDVVLVAGQGGDRRSRRRSGRCRSVCTTTTMKNMATTISPRRMTIGCHRVVTSETGVLTRMAKPAPSGCA